MHPVVSLMIGKTMGVFRRLKSALLQSDAPPPDWKLSTPMGPMYTHARPMGEVGGEEGVWWAHVGQNDLHMR